MAAWPVTAEAGGRVNIIGEHTDYTGGLALTFATHWRLSASLTHDGREATLYVRSEDTGESEEIQRDSSPETTLGRFVAAAARLTGFRGGGSLSVSSKVPIGMGMSSSGALSVALALLLSSSDLTGLALIQAAQRVEQEATGVPCGNLDQAAIVFAVKDHACLLDLEVPEVLDRVPIPEAAEFLVLDSGITRDLSKTPYAERRAQAEAAAKAIGSLKEADMARLDDLEDPVLARRARHIVEENARVREAASALARQDLACLGALMAESHESLRDLYEVSHPRVDELVEAVSKVKGVLGARMMGGGFGGVVIALAEREALSFEDLPTRCWRARPGPGPRKLGPGPR